ncbi:MAG: serine hydrolase domain-containing protein [Wenzhouxiangella sp.]
MKFWTIGILLGASSLGFAMDQVEFDSLVQQRVAGDRSGACIAVARVDDEVLTTVACADPDSARAIDGQLRFEIGSVSKALQGVLMARLVAEGKLDLNQPLGEALAMDVPQARDEPIRLVHLLTHTSGLPRLPAGMPMSNPANPYADVDPEALIGLLENAEISAAPGERWEYSNFGAMLLSLAITRQTGEDLDELFQRKLFGPLEMTRTAIGGPVLDGHNAMGQTVSPWDFHVNLAGVGGVRSSLDDLVVFMQAALGQGPEPVVSAIQESFKPLAEQEPVSMAWGWVMLPAGERKVLAHDGGTYGFSSFLVIDAERGTAAVVLSDTTLIAQGGLRDLALHLIDPDLPLGQPLR